MLEESLDWPLIEAAAAPSKRKSEFCFGDEARRAIGDALIAYADSMAPKRPARRVIAGDPVLAAMDPTLARRIQHHIAAMCRAANVRSGVALELGALQVDIHAIDRETSALAATISQATAVSRRPAPATPEDAFTRLVARIAEIYTRATEAYAPAARPQTPSPRAANVESASDEHAEEAEEEDAAPGEAQSALTENGSAKAAAQPKLDRVFVKFLRTLLIDAEEVLLGLPDEPSLRRSDGSFARRVRSALARQTGPGDAR